MHRQPILFALALTLSIAPAASGQVLPPKIPTEVSTRLKQDRFETVTSIRGLPLGVRDALQDLFGTNTLDIAEPGEPFRATDVVVDPKLPVRRLRLAACSMEYCIVYYERGGIAHTWHAAVFHWTPAVTRLEWGGFASGSLRTVDELRNAMLSGAIKASNSW
jgi:hypothetical protein